MKILLGLLSFLRWIIGLIFSLTLSILLIIGILLSSLSIILTNRENLKSWITTSGLLENVRPIAVEFLIEKPSTNTNTEENSFFETIGTQLKDPNSKLSEKVDSIISPTFLRNSVNTVIDSYYDWLEGKVEKPYFKIEVVENEKDLLEIMSVIFTEKAKQLPNCPKGLVLNENFDPMSTNCWPQGLDYSEVNQFIIANSEMIDIESLRDNMQFTSDSIPMNYENTEMIQNIYTIIRFLPLIFLVLIILLTLIITVIIPGFKDGYVMSSFIINLLSFLWIIVGVISLIFSDNIFSNFIERLFTGQILILLPYFSVIFKNITNLFGWVIIIHGISLISLSSIPFIVMGLKKKKKLL